MYLRITLGLLIPFVTLIITESAHAESPFTECSSRTGSSATLAIPQEANPSIDEEVLPEGAAIAAFTEDGICAGQAVWQGENVALVLWGDDTQTEEKDGFEEGEPISFRVWVPTTEEDYAGDHISFSLSSARSYYMTESAYTVGGIYVLSALEVVSHLIAGGMQEIALEGGWNLVSLYVAPEDAAVDVVLGSLLDEIVLVKDVDGNVFSPEFGINDIGTWEPDEAYWVYTRSGASFAVAGEQIEPTSTPITLSQSWMLVPYIGDASVAVEEALASVSDHLVVVQDVRGRLYFPDYSIQEISTLQPGQGYLVYVDEESTLTYPMNVFRSTSE